MTHLSTQVVSQPAVMDFSSVDNIIDYNESNLVYQVEPIIADVDTVLLLNR